GNIFAPPDVREMVGHEYIAGVKSGKWPRFPGKIWHRNYYECIVRNPEAERKIGEYIRMNPWKCISHFGHGMRGIGNPALLNCPKIGVLCSRKVPPDCNLVAAAERNMFVMQSADQLWVPHATPGGMLTRLLDAKSRRAR
ncbi:MAG: hypothetical protein KAH99_03430, partial [Verrucomicrobia bacterium]|nr:hypothetical protein [Verrucomicrobiota bacterium]